MNEPGQSESGDMGINIGPAMTAAVVLAAIAAVRRSRRLAIAAAAAFALEFFPPYRRLLRAFVRRMMARAEGSRQDSL